MLKWNVEIVKFELLQVIIPMNSKTKDVKFNSNKQDNAIIITPTKPLENFNFFSL